MTDSLLTAAFILRVWGIYATGDRMASLRLMSFQVLSFVSPFIWYVYISAVTYFGFLIVPAG